MLYTATNQVRKTNQTKLKRKEAQLGHSTRWVRSTVPEKVFQLKMRDRMGGSPGLVGYGRRLMF